MDLLCVIREVSLKSPANYYVFVQFKDTSQERSFKYRTEIVPKTEHPKFHKNTFTFDKINAEQVDCLSLKFGLFATTLSHDSPDLSQQDLLAKSISAGTASMKLSINAVTQLQEKGFIEHSLAFVVNKEQVGRIYFAIKVVNQQLDLKYRFQNSKLGALFYSPFQEDMKLVENNTKKLEEVAKLKMEQYQKIRKKLGTVRALEQKVHFDQDNLRKQVQSNDHQIQKISRHLASKIDPDSIKAEFQLLKDTSKGHALLVQKLLYLKERIKIQKEQQAQLSLKRKQLQPSEKKHFEETLKYAQLQKIIKQQRFQMHRGSHLLRIYNDLVNQIVSNEFIVRNLKELSKKSDLTAKQALIILEQAKYEHQLQKINQQQQPIQNRAYEIMEKIEGVAKLGQQEENQSFLFGYEAKLQALKNQISELDDRIKEL